MLWLGAPLFPSKMDDTVSAPVRTNNNTSPSSNKIVEEFKYLLEKSQQLFVSLRFIFTDSGFKPLVNS